MESPGTGARLLLSFLLLASSSFFLPSPFVLAFSFVLPSSY